MSDLLWMLITGICVGSSITLCVTWFVGLREHREWLRICDQATLQIVEARKAARWLYEWIDESEWAHFSDENVEILKQWPWLWKVKQ